MKYFRFSLVTLVMVAALSLHAAGPRAATFEFYPYDQDNSNSLDTEEISEWINMSRCLCDQEYGTADSATLNIRVRDSGGSYTTDEVYFYLGDDCDSDSVSISEVCIELAVINHSDFNSEQVIPIPANWIVDPLGLDCSEINGGSSKLYVIMGDPNNTATATYELTFDTEPPGTPEDLSTAAGEGSVEVSWDPPSTNNENIEYYNVLCSVGGEPLSDGSTTADFVSTREVCDMDLSLDASPTESPDCSSLTSGFTAGETPSPCFVCGSVAATNTTLRLSGLTDGEEYNFAVVAVDDNGNVSPISEVVTATPAPTTDFAEQYNSAGGKEEGGFCFVATAVYGSYNHPDVRQLRHLRDGVLARSARGRGFIHWYYENGPTLAEITRQIPALSSASWFGLQGLVWISSQLTSGGSSRNVANPARALPVGLMLMGLVFGMSRLSGRREEDETVSERPAPQDDPHQTTAPRSNEEVHP